jgi:hypothetical protein
MKKLILFIFSLFLLLSCDGDEIATVKLSQGDKRVTYTKDYIVIEECTAVEGFYKPVWKQREILNKSQNDTIIVILNGNGKK